nr:hypothetical protein [Candidatus Sigynarchaeota archaeon]
MSEYWTKKFACGNKKCGGYLIPLHLHDNKREPTVKVVGKCPVCKKTYEFTLPQGKDAVTQWAPFIFDRMFLCTTCGQATLRTIHFEGHPKSEYKIDVKCTRCNEPGERHVDGAYFHLIGSKLLEITTKEVASYCPTCGNPVPLGSLICSKCGNKIGKK